MGREADHWSGEMYCAGQPAAHRAFPTATAPLCGRRLMSGLRFLTLRYLGVLAGHAKAHAEVVPGPRPQRDAPLALLDAAEPEPKPPSRRPWAWLLARVFAEDS